MLTTRTPGAEEVRWGFEGGRVVKVGGTYHLFTSEMVDDPMWVRMRLGHWTSVDRRSWTRAGTVRESSGEYEGQDPRAALWSPLPVWDDTRDLWSLFYVAYRSRPSDGKRFLSNHDGHIWRSVSRTPGREGISGPWQDLGVVMQPGEDSLEWEGLQGTDSFFAWRVGGQWRAFYGSARTENMPIEHWLVGPAAAPALAGPWRRVREENPAPIEPRFIENPIVSPAPGGGWLVVYDSEGADTIGWSYSEDGIQWEPGRRLVVQPEAGSLGEGRPYRHGPGLRGWEPLHPLLHRLRAGAGLGPPPGGTRPGDLRRRPRGAPLQPLLTPGPGSRRDRPS